MFVVMWQWGALERVQSKLKTNIERMLKRIPQTVKMSWGIRNKFLGKKKNRFDDIWKLECFWQNIISPENDNFLRWATDVKKINTWN